ncbi:MAG: stage II sporulation protein M [Flavobacteriales bacterium]|nr:stage II sporulation protein M [Flavobacteriales bacterium]
MKEVHFIKKSQETWKMLEELLAKPGKKNPDQLSELYIRLMDDLSYARTYFPDSKTTQYLNGLSAALHQEIYRNKREKSNRIWEFWKTELPLIIRKYHPIIGLSFAVFFIAFAIGWISSENDQEFVRLILGDQYVNLTEENINKGKPMDVYGQITEGPMFLYITFNNIYVSFLFYVLGISFGIGTLWRLFSTGIMVGSFLNFFYQKKLFADAMLAIWMHGTIEISVAIIAGAAGLVLAQGIVFPGTYSRIESMKQGAKDGLKIVIGLVPCFIIAGFIESFLTRHYNVSPVISASVIVLSFTFIITYFGVYPIILEQQINRRLQKKLQKEELVLKKYRLQISGILWLGGGIFFVFYSFLSIRQVIWITWPVLLYGIIQLIRYVQISKTIENQFEEIHHAENG